MDMFSSIILLILQLAYFWTTTSAAFENITNVKECRRLAPVWFFDSSELIGTWHVIRRIEHNRHLPKYESKIAECPLVNIRKIKTNIWKFDWFLFEEREKFYLKESDNYPGELVTMQEQGGNISKAQVTLIPRLTILWALTVCRLDEKVFTIVLSRTPRFHENPANIISEMLSYQGLKSVQHYDSCTKKRGVCEAKNYFEILKKAKISNICYVNDRLEYIMLN